MYGARCKLCATPGCTLADFHAGAHSNELDRKQKRKANAVDEINSNVKVDACGMREYGGMSKVGQRTMFAYAARETDSLVMYLDGPDAALTLHLLEWRIDRNRIVPVNNSKHAAEQIEAISGVKCKVGDICKIAKDATNDEFGVVWFDMCGVDFGPNAVSDLLHCAATKFFTLSSRQVLAVEQQVALCAQLIKNQEKIVEQTLYTGRSGAMTMVFVVSKGGKSAKRCTSDTESDVSTQDIKIGTIVKIPLVHWPDKSFTKMYEFKIYDECLYGAVHSRVTNSDSQFRLTFQCNNGTTMLCSNKYHRSLISFYAI